MFRWLSLLELCCFHCIVCPFYISTSSSLSFSLSFPAGLQAYFSQYLSKLASTVQSLRSVCGLEDAGEMGRRAGQEGGGKGEEDWAHLQVAFTLIQCCGEWPL